MADELSLDALDRELLDAYQHDFPLTARPFATIAAAMGTSEPDVISRLERLQAQGCISRVGAVVAPHRTGWSTLAAMIVPKDRLEEVAAIVSEFPEVNHNYERTHRLNLWFVVTGADRESVEAVLAEITMRTGIAVLDLPMLEAYRVDLGFPLQWT